MSGGQHRDDEVSAPVTRYRHVDVGQFVAQDPQGFRHPHQFVSGQKALALQGEILWLSSARRKITTAGTCGAPKRR